MYIVIYGFIKYFWVPKIVDMQHNPPVAWEIKSQVPSILLIPKYFIKISVFIGYTKQTPVYCCYTKPTSNICLTVVCLKLDLVLILRTEVRHQHWRATLIDEILRAILYTVHIFTVSSSTVIIYFYTNMYIQDNENFI